MPFCLKVESLILESGIYIYVINVCFIHCNIICQGAGLKKQNAITHPYLGIIRRWLTDIIEPVFTAVIIRSTETSCEFLVTFEVPNTSPWTKFTSCGHPPKGTTGRKISRQFSCL